MCDGKTIVPAGKATERIKKVKNTLNLREALKIFWANITCSNIEFGQPKVNMCPKCFDLEIDNKWQKTAYPQRTSIGGKIYSGAIIIDGYLKRCDFCRLMKNEIKNKRKNLYKDIVDTTSPFLKNKLGINLS